MTVGRPREFDRAEALQKAMDVFWTRGYESTQVEDLLEAMGIGRGSMYAAFGDKRSLYLEALQAFCDQAIAFYRTKILTGPKTPIENLRSFISGWGDMIDNGRGRGCFISNALIEKSGTDEDVARLTSNAIKGEELLLRGVLSEAQENGQLDARKDPASLARAIVNARLGVTIQARLGASSAGVRGASEAMLALLE